MVNKKVAVVLAAVAVVFGVMRFGGGRAALEDGSYLVYRQGRTTVRVTFHAEGRRFRTVAEVSYDGEEPEVVTGMTGHDEVVDGLMRTESGSYFELAAFGPLWVQPNQLHEGGDAYGSRVSEMRLWNGREVAVVTTSVGMGAALRGEWSYDVETGFLVAGMIATAVSGPGHGFELVESNVPGLVVG